MDKKRKRDEIFAKTIMGLTGAFCGFFIMISVDLDALFGKTPGGLLFAVAGAMRNKSARLASAMCSTSHVAGRSNVSQATGCPESVSKVSGATKRPAFFVITTYTSTPCFCSRRSSSQALYAAMPPVTPRTTHFFAFSSIAYRASASGARS